MIANCRARGDKVHPVRWPAHTGFEVALLDDDLRELGAGWRAKLPSHLTAPPARLFREYWRNPEENAVRFRGDWYLTGDRATRDADGNYWFVGRDDDVIKSAAIASGRLRWKAC